MQRRIFGIENEYGVTCTLRGQRRLSPDEVARYLFRRVVSWGRSSNVFLANGARLYLDVGSHPEYATPECDSVRELVVHDKAGERILEQLLTSAEQRLGDEGVHGDVYLFKNNTDSAGNSYGCHENYCTSRRDDFRRTPRCSSPSSSAARSTPVPARSCRRRGARDIASASEPSTSGRASARPPREADRSSTPATNLMPMRALPPAPRDRGRLEHERIHHLPEGRRVLAHVAHARRAPGRAPRHDPRKSDPCDSRDQPRHDLYPAGPARNGREVSALDIQSEYLNRALRFAEHHDLTDEEQLALDMWEYTLSHLEDDPLKLDRELDWVIKYKLIEAYRERHDLALSDARVALVDLQYHDVNRERGVFYRMQRKGMVDRIVTDEEISHAVEHPPQTTRARLRGEFIKRAKERKRDYTVDWVHLKLNDQAQRTVLCKDPFKAEDERVDKLIASL